MNLTFDRVRAPEAGSEVVLAACGGSREAFGLLVECYRVPVLQLGLRLTQNFEDAEDVVQETFLRALRDIENFRPERPFYFWLIAIARNASFDVLRSRGRFVLGHCAEETDNASLGPEESAIRGEEARRVRDTLAMLPERHRRTIDLFYFERLRYHEIANTLGIPIGTVKTFIWRAKARLRLELVDCDSCVSAA